MLRAGHRRLAGDAATVDHDARRTPQAPGLRRGRLDWDRESAARNSPDDLRELWEGAVGRSRALLAATLTAGGLDQLGRWSAPDRQVPSLRWILVHLVKEYARHNGHADLLRQAVDGQSGE